MNLKANYLFLIYPLPENQKKDTKEHLKDILQFLNTQVPGIAYI